MRRETIVLVLAIVMLACNDDNEAVFEEHVPINPNSYQLPVVVHVLHLGEATGEGTNLSENRIRRQIELLNDDFRKRAGTRGFNEHPDGGDAKIEFRLANRDPAGLPTNGIVRKELVIDDLPDDLPNTEFEQYAFFSYWDSENYINVWVAPYPKNLANFFLGKATGPDSELPGDELFQKPLPGGAEGIIVNWVHFGESELEGGHNLGRTLTHEMGHYLGLLHTWGSGDCESNDYCKDTPAVDKVVSRNEPYLGCNAEEVMIENYMNYTSDQVMNIFTLDQIARMHEVLDHSPKRNSLLNSPGLIIAE